MKIASIFTFGVSVLTLPSSVREVRGIRAYCLGVKAFFEDDPEGAVKQLNEARSHMPEDKGFKDLEAFYSGQLSLDQGKFVEAAKWFQISHELDPHSKVTERLLLIAQRRAAFEAKNFNGYMNLSEALVQLDGRTRDSVLGLAPAWACRFVLTGEQECREKALACLDEARRMPGPKDPDLEWVDGWVKCILEKRQIISFTDYWYSIGKGGLEDQGIG